MGRDSEEMSRVNWFDRTAALLEQNIVGVKIGIYSVAALGLGIALRSVRPFAKFTRSSQIPSHFFEKRIKLHGRVIGVEAVAEKNPLLLVDHHPILGARLRSEAGLPVSLEGVDVSGNGFAWLQAVVKGEKVEFVLLKPLSESVSCIVYHRRDDVATQLVTLGFASVAPYDLSLDKCKTYRKFYQRLLKEETKAERKRVGMWQDSKKMFNNIYNYFLQTTKRVKMNLP
ncbi:uncharacterized protein LOC106664521 [Cimex lectularius]|uniref:TNase-like domain-containing protein n=1 Tax=Cimex lectularius TaxID=79782 RepID=A0A8I6RHZ8_CIMLE|nr:uncharacterized protein LOC106664521 [Cimex lectularius]